MALAEEIGDRWMIAVGHHNLANAHRGLGDVATARGHFGQALQAYVDIDDSWSLVQLVEDGVLLAIVAERPEEAFELVGAADALRVTLAAPRPPGVQAQLDAAPAASRAVLGQGASAAIVRGSSADGLTANERLIRLLQVTEATPLASGR
jgi:hypothetical protein